MTENNFQINSAAITDRGLSKKRPQNEDAFAELNGQGFFAVADGVGGAQAGDVASQMAVEILSEAFVNLEKNSDAEEMMKIAINRANEAIFQMSHDLQQLSTMATTIVALHVAGNIATIGHVGDSRLYRMDEKGNLFRETQDHSVVEEEVRAGRMTEAQAANHPSRNVISRALGADSAVEIDMKTIMFEPRTTFFLCSDGITRHIDDFELRELLQSGEEPADIVQKMKEICYERGAMDNLTAVIAAVTDKVVSRTSARIVETPADFEQATFAGARQSADSVFADAPEYETQSLKMPEEVSAGNITFREAEKIEIPFADQNEDTLLFPADEEDQAIGTSSELLKKEESAPIVRTETSAGMSKFLTAGLLLLAGFFVGAGVTYLYTKANPTVAKVPPSPVEDSPDIPYTAFEDNRRNVDENPELFIKNQENAENKDAEDYYLLGRAHLLTLNLPKAKESFEEARKLLSDPDAADNVNVKTLENEIAIGLALTNNPFTPKMLRDELNITNSSADQTPNANNFNLPENNFNLAN